MEGVPEGGKSHESSSHGLSTSALHCVHFLPPSQHLRAGEYAEESPGCGSSSLAAGRGLPAAPGHWLGGGDLVQKFGGGRLGPQLTASWALVDAPCTCPPVEVGQTGQARA